MYKKILYPALALFVAWFFAEGISVATFEHSSGILTAIGSIAFAALVTLSVFQFVKKERPKAYTVDTKLTEDKGSAEGCLIGILIIGSLFGFGIFLIFHGIERTKNEFKEHGVFAMATITGGSSYKTRKYDNTVITVHFENKKGEKRVANVDISASEFNKYYQDQQIPIVYSERYQGLVKILDSNDEINAYSGKNVRDINLEDLQKIFTLTSQKQITDYLNKLSPEWTYIYSYTDSSETYVNEIKQTGLKVTENEISYMLPEGADLKTFDAEAIDQGFEKIDGDKNNIAGQLAQERLYVGNGYMLLIRYKHVMPKRNINSTGSRDYNHIDVPSALAVVTLVKQ